MTDWGDNTISPLDDDQFREWAEQRGIDLDDPDIDLTKLYHEFGEWALRVDTILNQRREP